MQKIAVIDPSSRSLPYDFYYVREASKSYLIDFYCSRTSFNDVYIDKIRSLKNVNVIVSNISNVSKFKGIFNYILLLSKISFKNYSHIHFQWYIFLIVEFLFFLFLKKKLIITFHNAKPHTFNKKFFIPNFIINKIVSKIIFVSSYVQNEFILTYGKPKKYYLVNHGIFPQNISDEVLTDKKREIIFWGNIKPYKGVDVFKSLIKSKALNSFKFSIYGKWDSSLNYLKNELSKECLIVNKYLSEEELLKLLKKDCIFIIPYENASQSGILYSLLGANRVFISTDRGDNGFFLKKYNLENLLFNKTDLLSIETAINYAFNNYDLILSKLKIIKNDFLWENFDYEQIYN